MFMKINCYKSAFQLYVLYTLLPILHSIPTILQAGLIAIMFSLLLLYVLSEINRKSTIIVIALMVISFIFSYSIYVGEYTITIFSHSYGADKLLMLFLFWFPAYLLPGVTEEIKKNIFDEILVLCTITAVTTLVGIIRFDEPCRMLAKGTSAITNYYQSLNIGGYGFIYALIFIFPIVINMFMITKKKRYLLLLLLYFSCIIGASYGMALVVFGIVMFVYIYLQIKCNQILKLIISFIIGIIIFFQSKWENIFKILSIIFEKMGISSLASRMSMIYRSIHSGITSMHLGERTDLRNQSLDVFKQSPIWGNLMEKSKKPLGLHSEFCDLLGGVGILGLLIFIVLICIIYMYIRKNIKTRNMRNLYWAITMGLCFLFYFNTILSSVEISLLLCCVVFAENRMEKA